MDALQIQNINVHWVDLSIIGIYLVIILIAGTYLTRLASRGITSYFLGGRQIPWWFLGISGTASWFDVAGVMWMVAFFYIMGPRYMWPCWKWGSLALPFFAAYVAKWVRRSRVLTGAEWMVLRFGKGPGGESARVAFALLRIVTYVGMIGFAEYGCGHFFHKFIPSVNPDVLAISLMTATAIYTIAAGLYGVVLTNIIQFSIILIGSFILITKAIGMASYQTVANQVTPEWFGIVPISNWAHLENWELTDELAPFLLLTFFWIAKGLMQSIGGEASPVFLAARSSRDASKAAMLWGFALTPMFMVSAAVGVIGLINWGGNVSEPNDLYPVVIGTMLPIGVKGLVLAGLLSAFMSTFSAFINGGAAFIVRDIYQNFFRPNAGNKELVLTGRISSGALVVIGILIGLQAENIDTILDWIMMTLGATYLVPNILRWFWWRFNGQGYASGILVGIVASIAVARFFGNVSSYITFSSLLLISGATSIIVTLLTQSVGIETLKEFYKRTKPAGWWKPIKNIVKAESSVLPKDSFLMDIFTVIIGVVCLQSLYLASTYACTHQWKTFTISIIITFGCCVGLYFTWYKHLPDKNEDVRNEHSEEV